MSPLKTVLNVVMDWATFCAELARKQGRTALSLGLAGVIRGLVIDEAGVPLHYGYEDSFATGDLRTAIELPHLYCTHNAGCDTPSYRCQIDHIRAVIDGGPTNPDNLQPHCPPHNRFKETQDRKRRKPPPAA